LWFFAHNVPAVFDVFASPIKERVAFKGLQKCGGEKSHKGALAPTGVFRSPTRLLAVSIDSPVIRSKTCYEAPGRTHGGFLIVFYIIFLQYYITIILILSGVASL
jgi:hypothetical protein